MKTTEKQMKQSKTMERVMLGVVTLGATMISVMPTYAATNTYAEAGAKWLLDGVYWIVIVSGLFGVGKSAIQRNLTGAIGIFIATALVAVVCKNPDIMVSLGNVLKGVLGI